MANKLFVQRNGLMTPVERQREIDGIDYTVDSIEDIRNQLIILRDEALKQNEFSWGVLLSHTIAHLADYRDIIRATED